MWSTLRVHGPDAASWLHGIITCDVLSVKPGRAAWGLLLSKQGKIQADLQIVGQASDLVVAVCGSDVEQIRKTLDGYLVMEDAEIEASDGHFVVVHGPEMRTRFERAGVPLSRCSWGGEDTFLAVLGPDELAARQHEWSEHFVASDDFQRFLIESGVPRFGVDYSGSDNPHDASLERRTVDWSKGCYLGQEVVCMQDMRGKVKRRLVRVVARDGGPLTEGTEITAQDGVVGRITSSVGKSAIATIKAPFFEPGTRVLAGGGEHELEVEPLV